MRILVTIFFGFTACSAIDVSSELKNFDTSMTNVSSVVSKEIKGDLEIEQANLPRLAAVNNDTWTTSEACDLLRSPRSEVKLSDCKITKVRLNDSAFPVGKAEAVNRKINGLKDYISALNLLASAQTEEGIVIALAAFESSADKLNKSVNSTDLNQFVKELGEKKAQAEAAIRFSVKNFRARAMKKTVLKSQQNVLDIISETKALLIKLDVDPTYFRLQRELSDADDSASLATLNGSVTEKETAFRDLEIKYASFIGYAKKSIYTKLDLVAQSHTALAGRLKTKPSIDEIIQFVESLKSLSSSLEI